MNPLAGLMNKLIQPNWKSSLLINQVNEYIKSGNIYGRRLVA